MIRTQVSLTEEQMERLRRESGRSGKSIAQITREAIEQYLDDDREASGRRLRSVAGKYRSGAPDVAERHDEHLAGDAFDRKVRGGR